MKTCLYMQSDDTLYEQVHFKQNRVYPSVTTLKKKQPWIKRQIWHPLHSTDSYFLFIIGEKLLLGNFGKSWIVAVKSATFVVDGSALKIIWLIKSKSEFLRHTDKKMVLALLKFMSACLSDVRQKKKKNPMWKHQPSDERHVELLLLYWVIAVLQKVTH